MHYDGSNNRLSHRECLGRVQYTVDANTDQTVVFHLNPGDSEIMPWLHRIAQNYQEYELMGACFYFKSLVNQLFSDTSMAAGSVFFASDYNVTSNGYANQPFNSYLEAENTMYTTSGKPQMDLIHPIECDPEKRVMPAAFVRSFAVNAVPTNVNPQFFDWCKTQFTMNLPISGTVEDPVTVGELWFTVDLKLRKPYLRSFDDQHTWVATMFINDNTPLSLTDVQIFPNSSLPIQVSTTNTTAVVDTIRLKWQTPPPSGKFQASMVVQVPAANWTPGTFTPALQIRGGTGFVPNTGELPTGAFLSTTNIGLNQAAYGSNQILTSNWYFSRDADVPGEPLIVDMVWPQNISANLQAYIYIIIQALDSDLEYV